jgi:predicted DNA-binding transcriptional regulator YafY
MILSYEAFLQYVQSPLAAQSLSAITKLRNAMPPDIVRELDRIHQHVVVLERARSYSAPLLADLLQAALDGLHLDIVYDSRSGISERRIYPYGLFASQGFWYCACYDYRRGTSLSLRADRVRSLTPVEGLEPPTMISLREWLRTFRSDAAQRLHLRAVVKGRGRKSFELETLFGEIALNDEGEGVIETEIPEEEVDWYAAQLLTLGADLHVTSPPQLVDAIRRKAREITELYEC